MKESPVRTPAAITHVAYNSQEREPGAHTSSHHAHHDTFDISCLRQSTPKNRECFLAVLIKTDGTKNKSSFFISVRIIDHHHKKNSKYYYKSFF
jgi:hypothetical protein